MMLVGLAWAAFAPIVLVVAIALLSRALRPLTTGGAWPLAIGAVLLPVAGAWWMDHAAFRTLCETSAGTAVHRTARADGIYLNSGTANSFGMRYLHDEGFAWVEAANIYRRDSYVRYAIADRTAGTDSARITTTEIPALTAQYEVRETFTQATPYVGVSETQVIERRSTEVLARTWSANFNGGRARWVLGAWGARDCPSARTDPSAFARGYHLAKLTLR